MQLTMPYREPRESPEVTALSKKGQEELAPGRKSPNPV